MAETHWRVNRNLLTLFLWFKWVLHERRDSNIWQEDRHIVKTRSWPSCSYFCCFKCVAFMHCQTEAEAMAFKAVFPLVSKEPQRKLHVHSPRPASSKPVRSSQGSAALLLLLFRGKRRLLKKTFLPWSIPRRIPSIVEDSGKENILEKRILCKNSYNGKYY